jgi:hypothetical protein
VAAAAAAAAAVRGVLPRLLVAVVELQLVIGAVGARAAARIAV